MFQGHTVMRSRTWHVTPASRATLLSAGAWRGLSSEQSKYLALSFLLVLKSRFYLSRFHLFKAASLPGLPLSSAPERVPEFLRAGDVNSGLPLRRVFRFFRKALFGNSGVALSCVVLAWPVCVVCFIRCSRVAAARPMCPDSSRSHHGLVHGFS